MDTFMKADIFFFVTTISVVLITIFLLIIFFHLTKFLSTCNRIAKNVETKANEIGEEAEEFLNDVRNSFLFRLFFPSSSRQKNAKLKKK